ncbi:dienelactone hydrolase family protein [Bacterioplanes sanyensis]|nr:alpha/beta fold hydrolase [Bacterioplanes sanyensis]
MLRNGVALLLMLALVPMAVAQARTGDIKYNLVTFTADSNDERLTIAASLAVPKSDSAVPAVIVVHGSGGIDERGSFYSQVLNQAGFATLELDMWAARGLQGGLSRPNHVRDTLPDIYAALDFLQQDERIDHNKVGLIGFSWGGVVAMLMATEDSPEAAGLSALVANYPICWAYNKVPDYDFTEVVDGKSLLIVSGQQDLYDAPGDCDALIQKLPQEDQQQIELLSLPFATHAFELPRASSEFYDPYAFRGAGGTFRFVITRLLLGAQPAIAGIFSVNICSSGLFALAR